MQGRISWRPKVQTLGPLQVCPVVNFTVPGLVEVCKSWPQHPVIWKRVEWMHHWQHHPFHKPTKLTIPPSNINEWLRNKHNLQEQDTLPDPSKKAKSRVPVDWMTRRKSARNNSKGTAMGSRNSNTIPYPCASLDKIPKLLAASPTKVLTNAPLNVLPIFCLLRPYYTVTNAI